MNSALHRISDLLAGRRFTIVGVGNPLRGDDAVGPLVASRLVAEFPDRVIDAGSVPENFVGPILASHAQVVLFVDAAEHNAPPGRWGVWPLAALRGRGTSTHVGTLRPLGELLEAHGLQVWVVGIEPRGLEIGTAPSDEVLAAADRLVKVLTGALRREREAVHA